MWVRLGHEGHLVARALHEVSRQRADGRVDVWEADGRREPRPLKALAPSGGRGVQCACALGDGTAGVCVGGSAGLLRVYDTASGRLRPD